MQIWGQLNSEWQYEYRHQSSLHMDPPPAQQVHYHFQKLEKCKNFFKETVKLALLYYNLKKYHEKLKIQQMIVKDHSDVSLIT